MTTSKLDCCEDGLVLVKDMARGTMFYAETDKSVLIKCENYTGVVVWSSEGHSIGSFIGYTSTSKCKLYPSGKCVTLKQD